MCRKKGSRSSSRAAGFSSRLYGIGAREKYNARPLDARATFTTLAAVEKKLMRYSHSEVHGSSLTLGEVRRQARLFREKTMAERKEIPGLEPERADVILAGACLIERIMTLFHAQRAIVSDQGVRYGLLHERLNRLINC